MESIFNLLRQWSTPGGPPLVPASLTDIEDLEEKVGVSLPAAYHAFLSVMGEGMGTLAIDQADFRLTRIRERYDIASWTPPPRLICVGVDLAPLEPQSFYLDMKRMHGTDDCAVIRFDYAEHDNWETAARVQHPSLRELLAYWAFLSIRMPQRPYVSTLVPRKLTDEAARKEQTSRTLEVVEKLGAPRLPVAEVARIYDNDALSILLDRDCETLQLNSVRVCSIEELSHRTRIAILRELGLETAE